MQFPVDTCLLALRHPLPQLQGCSSSPLPGPSTDATCLLQAAPSCCKLLGTANTKQSHVTDLYEDVVPNENGQGHYSLRQETISSTVSHTALPRSALPVPSLHKDLFSVRVPPWHPQGSPKPEPLKSRSRNQPDFCVWWVSCLLSAGDSPFSATSAVLCGRHGGTWPGTLS